MLRVIVWLLTSIFLITIVRAFIGIILKGFAELMGTQASRQPPAAPSRTSVPISGELRKDPVCGTYVATSTPFQKSVHGETHFFCSEDCKAKFTA